MTLAVSVKAGPRGSGNRIDALVRALFIAGLILSMPACKQVDDDTADDDTVDDDSVDDDDDDAMPLETLVELAVLEPAGVDRDQAPIRTGVPFPRGWVTPGDPIGLFDAGDQGLPLQSRPLSLWDDGSVRWLLVDTQMDIQAAQEHPIRLARTDQAPSVADPLETTQDADFVTVDTGPLQLEIPLHHGGVIHRAWIDGELAIDAPLDGEDRGPWIQVDGQEYLAARLTSTSVPNANDPIAQYQQYVDDYGLEGGFNSMEPWPLTVVVEEEGPLHGVVRISGAHLDPVGNAFCTFVVRVHAYRGSATLRLDHTLVFTGGEEDRIASYGLRLPFTGDHTLVEGSTLTEGSVSHFEYGSHQITGAGTQTGQASGIVGRDDGTVSLAMILRDMAENYPKALVATGDGLEAQLYPAEAEPWDLSRYSHSIDTANGETGGVDDRGAQGLAKTETLLLVFGTGGLDSSSLAAAAAALDGGDLLALAAPQWYSDAAVMGLGPFVFDGTGASELHYRIDRVLHVLADFMRVNQREQYGWYGLEDYGDIRGRFDGGDASFTWWELGRYGWSGNSGEPSNQLWTQFLRAPSPQLYVDAEALARHTLDIQTVHFGNAASVGAADWSGHNREFAVGSLHRHGRQAWSGYAGLPEYSHLAGVETYYYLTGDERAREVLYEGAQFMMRYGVDNPEYTATVNGLDVLSRAAAVFHDQPQHASRFGDRADLLVAHLAAGSPNAVVSELEGADVSSAFGFFVRGAPGLLYHHERTGDPTTAALILDAADILVAGDGDAWDVAGDGEAGGVFYFLNTLTYAAGVAEAQGLDAQPYRDLARRVVEWNCHAAESPGTGAISQASLEAIPSDWRDWAWSWDEDPLDATPGILWIDRQLTFRNDYMQDYHSYRAFIHLAAGAASVEQGEGQPR